MATVTSVASIMKDVEALLVFLEGRHIASGSGKEPLRAFYERLAIHSSLEAERTCDDLDVEFYSLLEQWPDLRRSYLLMSQVRLHETCSNALEELVQLSHQRELSAYEVGQKRNLEQAITEMNKQIVDLLNWSGNEGES